MSKQISLTQGKFAIVDDEDFEYLNEYNWYAYKGRATFYARRNVRDEKTNKQTLIRIHREILKAKKGQHVDHINHNGLDNRKENLRVCNNSENSMNSRKHKTYNGGRKPSSKFKGVYWYKRTKKWRVRITINYKLIHLGYYNDEIEAAKAYDNAAIKYFGEFAKLNYNRVEK